MARFYRFFFYLFLFLAVMGAAAYVTSTLMIRSVATVVVPDLKNKDIVYALEVLTGLGLNTKVHSPEYNQTVPKNHVLYQEPVAGSRIKKDRDVRLVLSVGPKAVVMPMLVGTSLQQTMILLEQNGLALGALSRAHTFEGDRDQVAAQFPGPGEQVELGTKTDLLVSLGRRPSELTMPDFEGVSLPDALELAQREGLVVGDIVQTRIDRFPSDIVVDQDPLFGYRVAKGTMVRLTVNRLHPDQGDKRKKKARLFRYKVPPGFLKSRVRLWAEVFGLEAYLFDAFVSPGQEVWFLLMEQQGGVYRLYSDGGQVPLEERLWGIDQ